MKTLFFLGDARKAILAFPVDARRRAGFELDRVQRGLEPTDWKPMSSVGAGVREIRINVGTAWRVLYVAQIGDCVHVLHAFGKKSQRTSKTDLDLARARLRQLMEAMK